MKNLIIDKLIESSVAIVPIALVVLILSVLFPLSPLSLLLPSFVIGTVLLIIGMTLFEIGADLSMLEIGSKIGKHLTKSKNKILILIASFIIGFIITIAEPDLGVLARQVPSISSEILIYTVGFGVGLFLLFAVLRMILKIKLSYLLIMFCTIAFMLAYITPGEFVPLAFDSGGVTTGPISVPFILALGAGLTQTRHDKKKKEDSFGIISFCSIGPVIVVLFLGLIYNAQGSFNTITLPTSFNFFDTISSYISIFPKYLYEVLLSVGPVLLFFLLYNIIFLKMKKKPLLKILKGFIYTYIGLSIFLTGVNVGFLPMGYALGREVSSLTILALVIGMILGYFTVSSEPAVVVLTEQIEEITNGNIKKKVMSISLSIGVCLATGISVIRAIYGISIWYFLLPGYLIALLLTFFVPPVFTGIAFDSGGVASGTMTATFLLPFVIGITESLGGNVLTDAFGLIALVATIPLITIQIIGLIYKLKAKVEYNNPVFNEEIIDY